MTHPLRYANWPERRPGSLGYRRTVWLILLVQKQWSDFAHPLVQKNEENCAPWGGRLRTFRTGRLARAKRRQDWIEAAAAVDECLRNEPLDGKL